MATDQTIIDRLRKDCETWCCQSFDPESGAECHERHKGDTDAWCYGCTARRLAHALTAAHAARDAAERKAREHETAKYRAEERASEAIDMLKMRTAMVEAAKTGENWPCNACGFGHSAAIDANYEARCEIRAQLAEHERDNLRAQLTAAHAALANMPGHTCHVSGDTCGGCEYALERDKRITAALRERDEARAAVSRGTGVSP